ncbi:hypothetical protein Barb4_00478 [Bacteroidales bacterium Barb4]|nr:hypothetical protein Barb4_00478 [Bacteroidales bacterium Barb4]
MHDSCTQAATTPARRLLRPLHAGCYNPCTLAATTTVHY